MDDDITMNDDLAMKNDNNFEAMETDTTGKAMLMLYTF